VGFFWMGKIGLIILSMVLILFLQLVGNLSLSNPHNLIVSSNGFNNNTNVFILALFSIFGLFSLTNYPALHKITSINSPAALETD
jgi:hypothetical protein